MKCKNCGREIIRIRLGGRSVACDAAPITYWSVRGGAAMSEAIPLLTPNGESVYGALDGKLKDAVGMAYHPHTCGLLPIFHRGRDSWSRPIYDDGEGCFLVDVDPRAGRKPDICTKQGNAFNGEPCDPVQAEFTFAPHRVTWNQFQYNTKMPQKQGNQEGGNDYGNSQA